MVIDFCVTENLSFQVVWYGMNIFEMIVISNRLVIYFFLKDKKASGIYSIL